MELTRQGKVALVVLGVVGAYVFVSRLRDGGPGSSDRKGGPPVPEQKVATPVTTPMEASAPHVDRVQRDALRRRIEALNASRAAGASDAAFDFVASQTATPVGPAVPLARIAGSPLGQYVRDRLQRDCVPVARRCHQATLSRRPEYGGKLVARIRVVADRRAGAIIDSVDFESATTIDDEEMLGCVRDAFLGLTFDPPPDTGAVDAVLPIDF